MVLVKVGGSGGSSIDYGDGSDGSISWTSNQSQSGVFQATDVTIGSDTTISVGSPGGLVIFAQDSITVQSGATINASGVGAPGGGGGSAVGSGYSQCQYGDAGGPGVNGELIGGGGNGGRDTADGGGSNVGTLPPQNIEEYIFLGYMIGVANNAGINIAASGSGGEGGSFETGGNGGNGGGCVALVSPNITVDGTATIDVSGQNGETPGDAFSGDEAGASGGGGGAGGAFLAYGQSPSVTSSEIDASGGAGGNGGVGGFDCSDGSPGDSGSSGVSKILSTT
jgi:hypothetical protein